MAVSNVVAMSLRMRNTAARTAKDLRHEVRGLGSDAQTMGTKFGHAVKATRTSVGGLIGSFVSLRTVIAATFIYRGIQRFGHFLKSLTRLYREQEVATRILAESLAGWGNYSRQLVLDLHNQAMALQEVTNVDNEEIESMMALLASYGMTGKQIKEIIGLVLDLSKAKRIELKAATDLVGKAFVGYTGTLSRYGIILDKNLSREEKYAAMIKKISAYKGVASGITETYAGQVGVLGKLYDDMKKQMGAIIAHGYVQSGMFQTLSDRVKNTHDWFVKWDPVLTLFSQGAMETFKQKLLDVTLIMEEGNIPRWLFTIGNVVTIVTRAFTVWFRVVGEGINNLTGDFRLFIRGMMINWTLVTEGLGAAMKHAREWYLEFDEYMENVWRQRRKGHLRNEETIKNLKQDFADLKEIWEPATGKDFIDKLTEKMEKLRVKLLEERAAMGETDNVLAQNVRNRRMQNEVIEETIKLTTTMAQQYALASRIEQEQIKFLLAKSKEMSIADVAGLNEMEKKLIRAQGVLREFYQPLLTEFAQVKLGVEVEDPDALRKQLEERNLLAESAELRKAAALKAGAGVDTAMLRRAKALLDEKNTLTAILDKTKERIATLKKDYPDDPMKAYALEQEVILIEESIGAIQRKIQTIKDSTVDFNKATQDKIYDLEEERNLLLETIYLTESKIAMYQRAGADDPGMAERIASEQSILEQNLKTYQAKKVVLEEELEIARQLQREMLSPEQEALLNKAGELLNKTKETLQSMVLRTQEMQRQSIWLERQIGQEEELSEIHSRRATDYNSVVARAYRERTDEDPGILERFHYTHRIGDEDSRMKRWSMETVKDRLWHAGRWYVEIELTGLAKKVFNVIDKHYGSGRKASFERAD